MEKIKQHLKNNFAIYLILIACIIVICITLEINKVNGEKDTREKVNTEYYTVINVDEALALFDDDVPKFLIISTDYCSATIKYTQTVNYAMIQYDFKVYYLSITDVDTNSENFKKLVEKLDFEYNLNGEIDSFGSFMGATPMNIFIKNKRMVYGYIGTMNLSTLTTYTELYGVSNGKKY